MVNEVLQTVMDYVKLPHTDYAILINGPWGCGKTYFWKYMVEPQIRQKCETSCTPLYASFYGCENLRDIDSQLFLASHPELRSKWASGFSTAGGAVFKGLIKKFTAIDVPAVNLRWLIKRKDSVICFDDLERSNLPFKEVLGYINTFVEHEGAKVIILCNEKAVDAADLELYKRMKEKVVGNSLDYQPDYKTVLSTLIDEYKDQKEFHDFLTNNKELILHLFISSKTDNLRSLRRAITTLNMVFKTIYERGIDPNQLAEQLIYAVGPTAFELYGRAADPEKLRTINATDYIALASVSFLSQKKDDSNKKKEYEQEFNERYYGAFDLLNYGKAVGSPPICDFMITGYLDKDLLLEWAKKLTKVPDEKEQCIKQLLSDPREMDDEEFRRVTSQALGYIESGDISEIKAYVGLYGHFEWFSRVSLIKLTREQLLVKFKQGLEKAQNNDTLIPDLRLEFEIGHLLENPRSKECQDFCDTILKMNEQMFEKQRFVRIQTQLSQFQGDPMAFLNALTDHGEGGLALIPVFHRLDIGEIVSKVLSMPNDVKRHFGSVLNARYLKYQPQKEYIEELPSLIGIRDAIKSQCEEPPECSPKPMSLFITQNIIEVLEKTIEQLEALKKPKEEPAHE